MNKNINFFTSIFLIFFSIFYFIYGFLIDENIAGAGGYPGDFVHTWNNLQIYLNNNLLESVLSKEFFSNRSPLSYILQESLNPLIITKYNFRISIFFISLFIPVLLFYCLIIKYKKIDLLLGAVISSAVLFSPYVRTSGYWALEENYGFVALLLSYIFYNFYFFKKKYKLIYLSLLILCSSSCVYFDIKLTIVPLIIFFRIIKSNEDKFYKIVSVFMYFIASIPYLILIYLWKGIFPPMARPTHTLESGFYLDHIIFIVPILALYIFPFLFAKDKNIFLETKNFFLSNYNLVILFGYFLFLIYIQFFYTPPEVSFHTTFGRGYIQKLSIFLFEDSLLKKIFIILSSFSSMVIIILYLKKNIFDWLIIFYYLLLAIIIYPLLQEYFDPIFFLLILIFFKTRVNFNYKFAYIMYLYFFSLHVLAIIFASNNFDKIV